MMFSTKSSNIAIVLTNILHIAYLHALICAAFRFIALLHFKAKLPYYVRKLRVVYSLAASNT